MEKTPVAPVSELEPTQEEIDRIVSGYVESVVTENDVKSLGRVGQSILQAVYDSPGSQLESAKDTLWGMCNAVSYHVDHARGRTQDARLSQAWFGVGDTLKTDAVNLAVEMAGINVAQL